MLRFEAYRNAQPMQQVDLSGAYVFGQDDIPIRADIAAADHQIRCMKRMPGPAGLAITWDLGNVGCFLLPTTRLPERAEPFDSGSIDPGASFERRFTVPGTYKYFCKPHEGAKMYGWVRVEPRTGGSPPR